MMSNFNCDVCGVPILENEQGNYITGCTHYPLEKLIKFNKTTETVNTTFFRLSRLIINKDY